MPTATSSCPNCGAPLEFELGASISKVCEYCRHTVLRSDRGLENLGKVADLALTPAPIAVGDEGTLAGRPLRVMGRVQLDHGEGPWDEYYVAFDQGQSFGWLAFAQGNWFVTEPVLGALVPPFGQLSLEQPLTIAGRPFFVAELKQGQIVSVEGEYRQVIRPGSKRVYADCWGPDNAFATLDYGEGLPGATVFVGWMFPEPALRVTALGPRSVHKIKTTSLRCPNCGGDVPALSGERSQRLGCPYCGALSDIAGQRVISMQAKAREQPDIPVGSRGTLGGFPYLCIAYLRRGTRFDGEPYSWEEYLLWSETIGFRWLVKDPESGWSFVTPVNLADVDRSSLPISISLQGAHYAQSHVNRVSVEYVLGEVYWKCSVGETTLVGDYKNGNRVLSREQGAGEVHYSLSTPISWPELANAFSVPLNSGGARFLGGKAGGAGCSTGFWLIVLLVVVLLLILAMPTCGGSSSGSSYRGTGVFYGGK